MAKSARASTKKANNVALKSKVFGPVEDARTQRLSAKLLELAQQPKKKDEVTMVASESSSAESSAIPASESKQTEGMEVDQIALTSTPKRTSSGRGRIEKKRSSSRKASIVFPKFKNGKKVTKSKGKK